MVARTGVGETRVVGADHAMPSSSDGQRQLGPSAVRWRCRHYSELRPTSRTADARGSAVRILPDGTSSRAVPADLSGGLAKKGVRLAVHAGTESGSVRDEID